MSVRRKYREIRRALRVITREFPSTITLYHITGQTTNAANGTVVKTYQRIALRKVIVLPAREQREFSYDLAYIAANKNFTYGGAFDTAARRFLIDRDKLPKGLIIEKNDHIVYEGRRWDIKEVSVSAELRFVAPLGVVMDGAAPEEINPVSADDIVEVSETDG